MTTLSATLEAALIGQATKQDVIQAIDKELSQMDDNSAYIEANEIYSLMPKTYMRGAYYPVEYKGNQIKITVKRSPKGYYLHVLRPCITILKDTQGDEISRRPDFRHYRIHLFDKSAKWNEE